MGTAVGTASVRTVADGTQIEMLCEANIETEDDLCRAAGRVYGRTKAVVSAARDGR